MVYEEKKDQFIKSTAFFETIKLSDNIKITCGVAKQGFAANVWYVGNQVIVVSNKPAETIVSDLKFFLFGDVEFTNLDDLIAILEMMPNKKNDTNLMYI